METVGYIALFLFGGWASFVGGIVGHMALSRGGLEGFAADLTAGIVCLIVWACLFIWWLT